MCSITASYEIESAAQFQILDDAVCISCCTNGLEKGINPSVLKI